MIGPAGSVPVRELKRALREIDRLDKQYVDLCREMWEHKNEETE